MKKSKPWSVGADAYGIKSALWVEIDGYYVIVDLYDGSQTAGFNTTGPAMSHYEILAARKYEEE